MLVYEKVIDGQPTRVLYGTAGNVPSENDTEVRFIGADGQAVTFDKEWLDRGCLFDGGNGTIEIRDGETVYKQVSVAVSADVDGDGQIEAGEEEIVVPYSVEVEEEVEEEPTDDPTGDAGAGEGSDEGDGADLD